jgi:hypothetical protein
MPSPAIGACEVPPPPAWCHDIHADAGPEVSFDAGQYGCIGAGSRSTWPRGAYTVPPGFDDNAVTAVYSDESATVVLYDGPNLSGEKRVINLSPGQRACLKDVGFENKASSFRISDGVCIECVLAMCA